MLWVHFTGLELSLASELGSRALVIVTRTSLVMRYIWNNKFGRSIIPLTMFSLPPLMPPCTRYAIAASVYCRHKLIGYYPHASTEWVPCNHLLYTNPSPSLQSVVRVWLWVFWSFSLYFLGNECCIDGEWCFLLQQYTPTAHQWKRNCICCEQKMDMYDKQPKEAVVMYIHFSSPYIPFRTCNWQQ